MNSFNKQLLKVEQRVKSFGVAIRKRDAGIRLIKFIDNYLKEKDLK